MLSTLFYNPIYNLVVFLAGHLPDFGMTIIVTTIIVKLILMPIHRIQVSNQIAMQKAKPDLDALKEKQKAKGLTQQEKQALGMEMISIYQKHNIKFSAMFLPIFVQMPYLISMYFIFYRGGLPKIAMERLYSFVSAPSDIAMTLLGTIDLNSPNLILAVIAGATQFLSLHITMPEVKLSDFKKKSKNIKESFGESMKVNLKFGLPILIIIMLATRLNAAIALYWITINLMTAGQEYLIRGKKQELKDLAVKAKK